MHLILISRNFCSFLLIDESKLMKGARGGGGEEEVWDGASEEARFDKGRWKKREIIDVTRSIPLLYWTTILLKMSWDTLHFCQLMVFLFTPPPTPLPTPNTMLTFTQSKPTIPTFPWGGGGGGGGVRGICKTHFKIMCHQLPICPKDFWPGMEVYLVWPVNRFTLSTTVSKYDKQPIYFFLWVS